MSIPQIVFLVVSAITIVSAIAMVMARSMIYALLAMIVAFLGVASLYLLLEAEFLAAIQVLIYVGAIAVLALFAIMLTQRVMSHRVRAANEQWLIGLVVSVLLFAVLVFVILSVAWPAKEQALSGNLIANLGTEFLTTYALPFEVASILLLVALVGAILIARE
jgi:NADH-quinone oxidoreductase subunit J